LRDDDIKLIRYDTILQIYDRGVDVSYLYEYTIEFYIEVNTLEYYVPSWWGANCRYNEVIIVVGLHL